MCRPRAAVYHPSTPLFFLSFIYLFVHLLHTGPGGDPIRNPMVLPTGKNIHALDPQSIPTQVCFLFACTK